MYVQGNKYMYVHVHVQAFRRQLRTYVHLCVYAGRRPERMKEEGCRGVEKGGGKSGCSLALHRCPPQPCTTAAAGRGWGLRRSPAPERTGEDCSGGGRGDVASCAPELQSLPSARPCSVGAEPGNIDVHVYILCIYMYTYIYVHVHIYMYMYIVHVYTCTVRMIVYNTCTCPYIHVYIHYTCTHVHVHVHVHIHTQNTCMHVHTHVYMHM